jgi:hypothetical protein
MHRRRTTDLHGVEGASTQRSGNMFLLVMSYRTDDGPVYDSSLRSLYAQVCQTVPLRTGLQRDSG